MIKMIIININCIYKNFIINSKNFFFQVSLYPFFRKPNGDPLIERNSNGRFKKNDYIESNLHIADERIIKKITRNNWGVKDGRIKKEVYMIVTPRVVEEVR